MIKIYSTFSKDNIYQNSKFIGSKRRGPAFYIERIFKDSDFRYRFFVGRDFTIKININNTKEVGKIILSAKKQKIKNINKEDILVISPIKDEWILDDNNKGAKIFLDIQGYVRAYKKNDDFYRKDFWKDILCLKGTKNEINKLPKELPERFKEKILIITKGKEGSVIYNKKKKYLFCPKKINIKNSIGAGDTFFANFILSYLADKDVKTSGIFATKKTTLFLQNK